MTAITDAQIEATVTIMCDAIDRAEAWYCEILAKRYAGQVVTGNAYDRLADLDRQALRTVEAYARMAERSRRRRDDMP